MLKLADDQFGVHAQLDVLGAESERSFDAGDRRLVLRLVVVSATDALGDGAGFATVGAVDYGTDGCGSGITAGGSVRIDDPLRVRRWQFLAPADQF